MKIAMVLNFYFPYGGLQRDFARIARKAIERGHEVVALVEDWQGPALEGVEIRRLAMPSLSNHARIRRFSRAIADIRETAEFDCILGFNRLAGLHVYFAADSCFAARLRGGRRILALLPRYATYLRLERNIAAQDGPLILFLNDDQLQQYQQHYSLSPERYRVLPPGIETDRRRPPDHATLRQGIRHQLGLDEQNKLLLFLGSGFRIKGLDRALKAFAVQDSHVHLMIVGNDDAKAYMDGLPAELIQRIHLLGARDDVPALMQAADLLLHPAYRESAGMVLLEATVAGLPVLVTDTCGYAGFVQEAGSGVVLASPFKQEQLDRTLRSMLDSVPGTWQQRGLEYAENPELYRLPEVVVEHLEHAIEGREGERGE